MNELLQWLSANKIVYRQIDNEVVEIEDFGRMLLADLSGVKSIFRGAEGNLQFNLMESPDVLIAEGINYVAFPFGDNFYYYDLREDFRMNILKYIGCRQPCQCTEEFVNLGVHTPYELLNGSGDLALWVHKARWMGHTALGICDRNTMAGTLNLQKACAVAGINHVFGYSCAMKFRDELVDVKIYCQSRQGLQNLLRIQKEVMVDSNDNTISYKGLLSRGQGNVLVLGTLASYWMQRHPMLVQGFQAHFDKVYYQIDVSEYKAERIDREVLGAVKRYFDCFYVKSMDTFRVEPVLIADCYYPDRDDARSKVILNKIATGAAHRQSDDQYFKDVDEHYAALRPLFGEQWDFDTLFARMCRGTVEIAKGAKAIFETGRMFMPRYILRPEEKEQYGNCRTLFHALLETGLKQKAPKDRIDDYRKRLDEEVYIIESTGNVDYFLVQWDMVAEAHRRGIVTGVGRGSAGGSLVSYLLGITSIDPVAYDLLFSRFLVPERCGLNWVREITVLGGNVQVEAGSSYVEIEMNGRTYLFDRDAQFRVGRGGEELKIYADQLQAGDDIHLDRRDILWNLE
jgi:DNA polymerase-3 subunit alpha|nr:MAG TPA_asm: DNA polymerase III, alpha subunit [Caudoviricetes sp.]